MYLSGAYQVKFKYPSGNDRSDELTEEIWFDLLKHYDVCLVKDALRSLMIENPEWPPTAPEVAKKTVEMVSGKSNAAEESWNLIEKETNFSTGRLKGVLDESARIALKRIGGVKKLGEVPPKSLPFARKEYIFLYCEVSQEIYAENIKRIANGDSPLVDGAYESEYIKLDRKPGTSQLGNILNGLELGEAQHEDV